MNTLSPKSCPRWANCSAPVCPLDSAHADCQTANGETVCAWLLEAVKADGVSRIPVAIAPAVCRSLETLQESGGAYLRGRLKRARESSSRMALRAPSARAAGDTAPTHTDPAPRPTPPPGMPFRSSETC